MTQLMLFTYLVASDWLDQIVVWLPLVTLALKFLSALLGLGLTLTLLGGRIRRWRRRRPPRG